MLHKLPIHEATLRVQSMRKEIAEFIDKIKRIGERMIPYLKNKRENGKYMEYIGFGGSLIEYMLTKQFVVFSQAHTFSDLVEKEIKTSKFSRVVEIKLILKDGSDPLGGLIRELQKNFQIDIKYPLLFQNLEILKKKRNKVMHHTIEEYEGDFDKADKDLESYAKGKPIEVIFDQILEIQDQIADQQTKIYKLIFNKEPDIKARRGESLN
jgi:hypothetical protein